MTRTSNDDGETRKKSKRSPAPLSVKILVGFSIFAAFVIALLWLFQTVLYYPIYGAIKRSDMKNCAEYVTEQALRGNSDNASISAAKKYNCCVSVFEIDGMYGDLVSSAHIQTACMIHKLDDTSLLNELYNEAKKNGTYIKRLVIDFDGSEKIVTPETRDGGNPSTVIMAQVATDDDGVEYLVLVDSEISPISATTRVLMYQLIAVTAVLLIAAVAASIIISKKLSRPIEKMTKEASLLATGNYDVNFEGGSFREAKELGDTLNYAAGELSKLDSMQKELIANISHDLRTPLTLIRGNAELMRDIPGEMNAENIQVIIDETSRLSSLVSDLLDLSKLTEEGASISPERFSLTGAVEEALSRYSHLIEKDGYSIDFESDGEEVFVFADKTRIMQVLYNLVNNAVNYTGEDKKVAVRQDVLGGKVKISVTDTGEGIPEDQLPKIWERYYKAGGFHNRGKVGSGLGLSIVKNVLKMHNASFGVTSRPGSGSTFWFELEIVE